jgi:lipopolysaccharide/colanic/teichoic acid biosynthesis glycosyltransferase
MSQGTLENQDATTEHRARPLFRKNRSCAALRAAATVQRKYRDPDSLLAGDQIGVGRQAICPCPLWKRIVDIVGSATLLIVLSPLLLALAVFIKCVSRGPVLFRQHRYGLGGRPFRVWKFRTIEVSAAKCEHRDHVTDLMHRNGELRKRDHELDVIPGGRLMRKLGIDELPQLINVLKGEMSMIGPRPDVVPPDEYMALHRRRFDVLPGITGLWQVSGKNRTTFEMMMQLDLAYVRRRSPSFDMLIVAKTLPALYRELIKRNPLLSGDGG